MNTFERHLIDCGMYFQVAGQYGRLVDHYLSWVKANGFKVARVKRSQYTDYEEYCRKHLGNKQRTINQRNTAIKRYYDFKAYKNNPAYSPYRRPRVNTLPTNLLDGKQLLEIYQMFAPVTMTDRRNKCMLGMILFQGLKRSEVNELRLSDIDFDKSELYLVAQRKTNDRKLPLEGLQILDLHKYIQDIRPALLQLKYSHQNTEKVFVSTGSSDQLFNTLSSLVKHIKAQFPQISSLTQIRQSVIVKWEKEEGVIEAKVKAGHRYVSSTERYKTSKIQEIKEELQFKHPLELI